MWAKLPVSGWGGVFGLVWFNVGHGQIAWEMLSTPTNNTWLWKLGSPGFWSWLVTTSLSSASLHFTISKMESCYLLPRVGINELANNLPQSSSETLSPALPPLTWCPGPGSLPEGCLKKIYKEGQCQDSAPSQELFGPPENKPLIFESSRVGKSYCPAHRVINHLGLGSDQRENHFPR